MGPCTDDCRPPRGRHAHCASCHRTFNSVSTFDEHRLRGACVIRGTMSEKNGLWGNWGTTNGKTWWAR